VETARRLRAACPTAVGTTVCPESVVPRVSRSSRDASIIVGVMTSPSQDDSREATLQRIVTALRWWAPERVILFGSHARGEARPESDLDILVVLRDERVVTRQTVIDMRLAIGTVPVDYDLLITSSQDFAWRREYVGTIEYPAAHEGIELYAA